MKIAIASDLHLEFSSLELKNDVGADVLVLAGDIFIVEDLYRAKVPPAPSETSLYAVMGTGAKKLSAGRYRDFICQVSKEFKHVVYVMGNHEFYHGKFHKFIDVMRQEIADIPNFYLLERDSITLDGVKFVGGTLWTDANRGDPLTHHALKDLMNDYRLIRNDAAGYTALRVSHTVTRHVQTLGYFQFVLDENKDKKCVVVSHHAPTFLSIHDNYKDSDLMNGGYASDLSDFILDRPQIKLWIHGHTHNPFDYLVGDTRVVCNPRGYVTKNFSERDSDFELKVVEV